MGNENHREKGREEGEIAKETLHDYGQATVLKEPEVGSKDSRSPTGVAVSGQLIVNQALHLSLAMSYGFVEEVILNIREWEYSTQDTVH